MSLPNQHAVYRVHGKSLNDLRKHTEPLPEVGSDQVLVQVKAVSLNSRDMQVVNGKYPMKIQPNIVPCSDMAGVVVAKGANVSDLKVGQKVVSNFNIENVYDDMGLASALGASFDGTLREYVSLPAQGVNKVNANMPWEEAASLVCTGVTTWNALYGLKRLLPGDVVVMLGTGGVSLTALAIAKKAGAVTIVTSSSDDKLAKVKKDYGADYTVNYKTHPEWADQVLEITNGKGANYVIENGGAGTIKQSIKAAAREGVISLIGFVAPRPSKMPDVFTAALLNGVTLRGILVGNKKLAQELIKFVENKGVKIPVDRVFKFHNDEVHDAFKLLESSQQVGKICISFDRKTSRL